MRTSSLSPVGRLAIVGALLLAAVAAVTTTDAPRVMATGGPTWWVATSGTTDGSASSCADPDAVGTTHVAIQSILDQAADGDMVYLCAGTYSIGATLTVAEDITLTGDGVAATILDGGSAVRIMEIASTVSHTTGATIDSIQFRNGRAARGGAISAGPDTRLTINRSLFRNNVATDEHGGAVDMAGGPTAVGSLHVVGSTFLDNRAKDDGGAISTAGMGWPGHGHPESTITNSTFVGNTGGRQGGAVNSTFGTMRVSHSTFLDNRAYTVGIANMTPEELAEGGAATYKSIVANSLIASTEPSPVALCFTDSPSTELTANVTTDASCNGSGGVLSAIDDLNLKFLAPWGGDTPTVAIGANSDAIDAVESNCTATDQRGVSRGGTCDAGAFEYVPGAASLTPDQITLQVARSATIAAYSAPASSGLTSPTYRLADEVGSALPAGVTMSPNDGRLTGTPTAQPTARYLVITASDSNGAVASMRIDACALTRAQDGSYLIGSRADLSTFGSEVCGLDADYRLTNDIAWNDAWTGVGNLGEGRPFTGTFDGGGHTITGLDITGGDYSAFISYANGATISAVSITVDVEGGYGSAGLLGYAEGTHVVDVHGSGTAAGAGGAADCISGLIGETLYGGTIADSSFTGTVNDPGGDYVGGLVACAGWPVTISRSSFSGSVTGDAQVGALVGWMSDAKVVDSFAVGEVTASANVGGLVGWQENGGPDPDAIAVSNSYASVALHGGGAAVGGLVGSGESTAVEASFWESGLATSGALTAIGAASDLGNAPTGSAATDPADLRGHGFLDAAGWAVVDGWVDPATTSDVWGVCESMGLPFHLHRYTTNPCVVSPEPSPEPSPPPLPSALVDMTGQPAQSAGPSTTVPTTPTTTPTTTTPTTVPASVSTPDPALSAGESAVFVDGRAVATETTWTADGSLTVRIGDAEVGMGFEPNATFSGPLGRLRQGRPLRLRLTGLRPGSAVTATLFSTPLSLGSVTADQSGVVDASLTVPDNAPAGRHRLRLEVLDREGRAIEVWAGVEVDPGSVQLPATGRSAPVVPALMLLLAGVVALGGARRRHMTAG